jgi:hypothetical protein
MGNKGDALEITASIPGTPITARGKSRDASALIVWTGGGEFALRRIIHMSELRTVSA